MSVYNLEKKDLSPLITITKKVHEILKNLEVLPNSDEDSKVIHFTSLKVYEEIFGGESLQPLWMANIDGCNDPDEGKVLFQELGAGKDTPDIDSYPLITSFCQETSEKENLPMWHMYADGAKGVALVVDKNSLIAEIDTDMKNTLVSFDKNTDNQHAISTRLFKVFYIKRDALKTKPKNSREHLDSEISKNLKVLQQLYDLKVTINEIKDSTLKKYIYQILIELAHVIKYDDYQHEQEIRLVRFAFRGDIKGDINSDANLKLCPDSKRVYMEAPKINYKKIVTAPKMEEKDYRYVKYLADKHEIDTEPSKIRFR